MTLEDGTKVLPGRLEIVGQGENAGNMEETAAEVFLTIQEGKFHQVKRMFQVLGCQVEYLKRVSFGTLTWTKDSRRDSTGDLRRKKWRR